MSSRIETKDWLTPVDKEWLTVMQIQAQIRLGYKATLRWIYRYVPAETIGKRGRRLVVHITGLNAALTKCTWHPSSVYRKGYQGCLGRKPVNVNCRDALGKFVSHRLPGSDRPAAPKKVPPWIQDRRDRQTRRERYVTESTSQPEERVKSSGKGVIYSCTTSHRPQRREFEVPYTVAIVELEEGWHMLSNVIDCPHEEIEIGMPVEVSFVKMTDEITLPMFRQA